MPILKNHKHEKFVSLIARGECATEAYVKVYKIGRKAAGTAGPRLLQNVGIQQRLTELQQITEKKTGMSMERAVEFLVAAIETPIGMVDERSPLCQAAEYTDTGRKIKMVDKLRAMELMAKFLGWVKQDGTTINVNGDKQAIIVNLPSVMASPRITRGKIYEVETKKETA